MCPEEVIENSGGEGGSGVGDGGGSSTPPPAQAHDSGAGDGGSSSGGGEGGEGAGDGGGEKQLAYQPNYKLKVMDQEKEIPESFRSLMKDAKTEKEVREIFEKAYGLDFAKPKHEATQQSLTNLQAEHNYLLGSITELKEFYGKGDLDSFFEKLAIPPEKILQYALQKVNYQELPPEQRAIIDARRQAEIQARNLQRQNVGLQRQYQDTMVQTRSMMLNSALADAGTKSIVESFDARVGQPGAFRREVINRGRLAAFESQGKVDLTPEQAIQEVIKLYNLNASAPQGGGIQQTGQAGSGQQRAATIPNVGGGKSATPVKQKPRSIEDIKKLYNEMQ